jgi:hypothetical protein
MKSLTTLSDIRRHFYRNELPTYFISATPFNLLGMDEWVRHFTFVNYIDCFDGAHPHCFVPKERPHPVFKSMEEINNYLLDHPDFRALVKRNAGHNRKHRGNAVFLMFDERTEELCDELGLKVCFPSAHLRTKIDNKIMTTRIGNEAGVKSVPNALSKVKGWDDLQRVARRHKLGPNLVIQTAFGDSGHTTFFISNEREYKRHAEEIEREKEVKVMRRVRCRGSALEACVTRHGTIVGPLMTELVGFKELTPYKGGWCGNEVLADAFPQRVRDFARKASFKIGEALRKRRYRGYFEVDFLRLSSSWRRGCSLPRPTSSLLRPTSGPPRKHRRGSPQLHSGMPSSWRQRFWTPPSAVPSPARHSSSPRWRPRAYPRRTSSRL